MMYRPQTPKANGKGSRGEKKQNSSRRFSLSIVTVALMAAALLYAFVWHREDSIVKETTGVVKKPVFEGDELTNCWEPQHDIPRLDFNRVTYRQLFDDSNYVQLEAARAVGIDPSHVGNPATNKKLVSIYSTKLYIVDTMYHSVPYLIPDAAMLLRYVGERFQVLMKERYAEKGDYRIIVTSALRTNESVRALRRVNRNATDTSCHIYGTTFDLSAQRYRYSSGVDTVVEFCKQVLAQTLYELRSEGLCYVKYERGSCFHITVRSGVLSENRKPLQATKEKAVVRSKPKKTDKAETRIVKKSNGQKVRNEKTENKHKQTRDLLPELTERERLSMEQFER